MICYFNVYKSLAYNILREVIREVIKEVIREVIKEVIKGIGLLLLLTTMHLSSQGYFHHIIQYLTLRRSIHHFYYQG